MDTITNHQTINNGHNIPFRTHVFLIIYVFLCIMVKKRYTLPYLCIVISFLLRITMGTYKVRNEIETKRNQRKRNEINKNKTKRNEINEIKTK